ncbi:hypothetical protein GGG16DRAFT_118384 [Schizophyllum commune]
MVCCTRLEAGSILPICAFAAPPLGRRSARVGRACETGRSSSEHADWGPPREKITGRPEPALTSEREVQFRVSRTQKPVPSVEDTTPPPTLAQSQSVRGGRVPLEHAVILLPLRVLCDARAEGRALAHASTLKPAAIPSIPPEHYYVFETPLDPRDPPRRTLDVGGAQLVSKGNGSETSAFGTWAKSPSLRASPSASASEGLA